MDISLFDFELPHNLIAQTPIKNREESKLMVVDREKNQFAHKNFYDIYSYLNKGDVLVLNDTRVFPARIYGVNTNSNGKMEFLIIKNIEGSLWQVMCKPAKRAIVGREFSFGDGMLKAKIIDTKEDGTKIVKFEYTGDIFEVLNSIGEMPLPPYIKEKLLNKERYQTIYSKNVGSIAAPTAGLHFTNNLLEKIKAKGVKVSYITLHVGLGTFMPVKTKNLEDHKMHSEYYEIKKEVADTINEGKRQGNKIIAVGTTTMRTLETVSDSNGFVKECSGYTDIFIKPNYKFKIVDSLITNFHLPKSTLLVLVSAFYNREKVIDIYKEAIDKEYRFFSFGDSMLII